MNRTMTRKFCTLKEAGEQLDATQEQVENLLRTGVLREFRDGSHRLVRTTDVSAIVAASGRRDERQGRTPTQCVAGRPPRSTAGVPRTPDLGDNRPTPLRAGRNDRDFAAAIPYREPLSRRDERRSASSRPRRTTRDRTKLDVAPGRQDLSIREWFWAGLAQDRPITIALFSALVLLALSAAVVGACMLAGIF